MLQRHYTLAPRSRLERSGDLRRLVCTYPLQSIELNESAWQLLHALADGTALEQAATGIDAATVEFLDGLALSGALRAEYHLRPCADLPPVEVVVPAYGGAPALARCLAALAAQDYPPGRLRVTVVDDASPEPLEQAVGAPPPGLRLRWLRMERNAGPASARNAGVETPWPDEAPLAAPPWLAFTDADCVPASGWLAGLAALLEDPHIDAAGGAVRGLHRAVLLGRYEDACSSLYLGPTPGPVGLSAGGAPYLPSCNLGVRRDAFEAVGGFRAGLRFGEDVDLGWRFRAAGRGLFYHPQAALAHEHRTRWGAFVARRRAYARSEAWLRAEHPARFGPLWRAAPAAVLVGAALALAGAGAPGALVALLGLGAMALRPWWRARKRPDGPRFPLATLLAAGLRGAGAELLHQARRLLRQGAVLVLLAALAVPPWRPLAAVLLALAAAAEWMARRPVVDIGTFLVGYLVDVLAYSAGRLEGALGQRWGRALVRTKPPP